MQSRLGMLMPWLLYRYNRPALFQEAADGTPLAVAWQSAARKVSLFRPRLGDIVAICETAQVKLANLDQELDAATSARLLTKSAHSPTMVPRPGQRR
jgi:hypothetical protein